MITEQDLQAAIAECKGQRSPNASTCMKLASYYIIHDKLFGGSEEDIQKNSGYSFASKSQVDEVTYLSDTEFADAIYGMDTGKVLAVMDELMTVLQVTNKRLYDGVMRKLSG